jgi:hypothetical protein
MDVAALQLAAGFALGPNRLGYCGQDSAPARLKACIENGTCDHVEEELKKFIVLYPYLKTISQITGLDPFSYDVIESYWLGNDLLKQVKPKHYDLLLENFSRQGVPEWLLKELKGKRPKIFIPTHTFQVLHVGVGRASGSVPYNQKSINSCLISLRGNAAYHWGRKAKILTPAEKAKLVFWTKAVKTGLQA